ncbi:uncharacterized protein LOC133896988 [Phragmites australis]|uniref:uncharacterized protein LOC133896988 n=1 Tax=Phragmites australis TaxID=29695 RepID=UPI002D76A5AC|nr:uncharacterized protein LOC133896988 [Phragmites australis]
MNEVSDLLGLNRNISDRGNGLEEAMKKLQLSEVERKGIKVPKTRELMLRPGEWHAVGLALADKPIFVEGIHQTLGKIWCPDKGMIVKEMGDNIFLFYFNQLCGMKRALEDGPWTAGHSLLVMAAYDARKDIDAMEFTHIPIWIRVGKLPMGMMNRVMGEIIGNEVGKFLDVDVDESGTAAGRYLRIKVSMDIRVPIMRGVTLEIEDEGGDLRWCPLEYEFLPELCYSCGIIGHIDKNCKKGAQTLKTD